MTGDEERRREFVAWAAGNRRAVGHLTRFAASAPDELIQIGFEQILSGADNLTPLYAALVEIPEFLTELVDPWKYTLAQAVTIAKRLAEVDLGLDLRLARELRRLRGSSAERALLILDEISTGRRIIPLVKHLVAHSDPRICSKSVLMLGKRLQEVNWARERIEHALDPRVRANAIEALWGISTPPVVQMFRDNLDDQHHRVVGNSIVGLHLAPGNDVKESVLKAADDPKAAFRTMASWVMGKIGDADYSQRLSQLVRDEDAVVRRAALRSLREIRQRPVVIEPVVIEEVAGSASA